jgi:hypothetical protein
MMKRNLLGGLAAATVTLAGGAALSDTSTTLLIRVVNFNIFNHQLTGQPLQEEGPPILFLDTPTTSHLPAIFGPNAHPSDPCFGTAITWNGFVVASIIEREPHTAAFESLLAVMAAFQCNAQATATTPSSAGAPAPIVSIAPSVN